MQKLDAAYRWGKMKPRDNRRIILLVGRVI